MNVMKPAGALVLAAIIILSSLAFVSLEAGGIVDGNWSERGMGMILGFVLILYGNAIPKLLTPLAGDGVTEARKQSLKRFSGWVMVISGIGYMLAWLALPIDIAAYGAVACGVTGIVIVIGRCLMMRTIA